MSEDDKQAEIGYGQLMKNLLDERHQYATEEEFRTFAVAEVRRFITDLRELEIEVTMRPIYLEKSSPQHSPKE
jgi:translation initiation factor RLI1